MNKPLIYFDNAATTAIDAEVLDAMIPYLSLHYGNPSSIHTLGRQSKAAIEQARKTIAQQLNCATSEIYFTSGGTESNNTILTKAIQDLGVKHIITSPLEHHCILHTLDHLHETATLPLLTYLEVDNKGKINLDELEKILSTGTEKKMVSLMHANNEIGTINPLIEISQLCQKYNVYFHTDAVQSMGHYKFDLQKTPLNFLTGSAHKFHGPKGIGFMYVNAHNSLKPFIHGGAQERNVRAGTENVSGIVGLSHAMLNAYNNYDENSKKLESLKTYFINQIQTNFPTCIINGAGLNESLNKVLNVGFAPNAKSSLLLFNLDIEGICASSGSACSSGSDIGSHVLKAINVDNTFTCIRFSFSKYNTIQEIDYTIQKLKEILA